MITEQQHRQMMPNAGHRLDAHLPFIVPAMEEGEIDTPKRIAAFLAQAAHESGETAAWYNAEDSAFGTKCLRVGERTMRSCEQV